MLSGLTFGSKKELEKQFREEAELEKAKKREDKKQQRKHKKVCLQAAPSLRHTMRQLRGHADRLQPTAGEQEIQKGQTQEGVSQA